MPFDLTVHVTGLCLLVPFTPESSSESNLWVLMPKADGPHAASESQRSHEHHVPEHLPVIVYDPADLRPTGEPTAAREYVEFAGRTIVVSGSEPGKASRELAKMDVKLSRFHGQHAELSLFEAAMPDKVSARVELRGVNSVKPEPGALWLYKGQPALLHTGIVCSIPEVPLDELTLETSDGELTLYPRTVDGKSVLKISIQHLPRRELPPRVNPDRGKVPRGQPPKHWEPYRTLLGITDSDRPTRPERDKDLPVEMLGVNPYACMVVPTCPKNDPTCP